MKGKGGKGGGIMKGKARIRRNENGRLEVKKGRGDGMEGS